MSEELSKAPDPLYEERYLTPKEARLLLQVHPITLNRWAKDGHVPSIMVNGHRRYPEYFMRKLMSGQEWKDEWEARTQGREQSEEQAEGPTG